MSQNEVENCPGVVEYAFEDQQIEEFLRCVAKRFCPECGEAFPRNPRGRPKVFCCDACRRAWWEKHPQPEHWKSTRKLICPVCGREFLAIRDYAHKRKYCSRSCSNKARGKEYKNEQNSDN